MRLRKAIVTAAAVLAIVALMAGIALIRQATPHGGAPPSSPVAVGPRIRVQVLNATATRGLARRVTEYLRDKGFDVVALGTAATRQENTLVLDRSGHPDWANRVARALGASGRAGQPLVESRLDSSADVDVTVVLGSGWRAPAKPFYP